MHIKLPTPVRNFLVATSFWKEYYFILREFKHFRQIAILAAVFTLSAAVLEGFGVGFILAVLHSVLNPNAKPIQTGVSWFDVWILAVNASTSERLFRSSALVLLTTLLRLGLTYLGRLYVFTAQYTLGYRLSLQVFEQLQALSLSFFTKTRAGNLVNSLTSEVNQITLAFDVLATFFTRGSTLIAYTISMFMLSWQLTAITAMLFGLLSVGITSLLGQIREASFATTKARRWYVSVALEFINGIRTVQAFAAQDFERKRFHDASLQLLQASTKSRAAQALVEPVSEGIATFILFGILFLAFAVLIPNGQLQPAGLLTFLFVLLRLMPIRRQLDGARAKFSSFQGSFSNIKELLRTDNKTYLRNGKLQFSKLQRAIEFVSVDFGYDKQHSVLHNIKLTINRGEMTALVGSSGAGKTTLADLIPRFYDPTQGQIFIDGIDLQNYDIKSLRRKLAVVSQDTFIFNASVRDNIAYALEEVDEDAVWEAARLANALEFIHKLPEGFDTQLGERGVRLSGGQRQRLAIARALLRDPDILILDEATSALDSVSERLIQESLEKLSQGRTVIAIAHRLSTIVRADKVVVLEQGRILEQGTYQELLQQRGNLWKYHQMQHEVSQMS
ncbi:MAG: Heterocyst differentiation ATP-binding protein HepA [Chroococcidiopsis cubana SAG 39.79]|uniref:HlyB/MsbA family ABC transporter n=1 Tax=Chroococcidiopsis cubana SAG 39.79 TaxID=388085 RepID=A0AB37UJX0_9CYAN|nr:heterocyst formation ABC transporter subunit HepA [Chroococcidiopsis cubana]MDZ4873491.1 Heterocyst differentiation ATP-binding protein HepA [Chroococcidiopsis cubana SAG 39.79]PSB61803.1 ABC transporter ATP-binding protein [Chroococcidiopsis cubana CCALA 043]RUT11681.1 HlyB/MsbA family ABC transporter [Chroococcidiopsis cubana SAG 39.79]